MATITGPYATGMHPANAAEAGNFSITHRGSMTVVGADEGDVLRLSTVDKGSIVHGIKYGFHDLGADNGFTFGYEPVDPDHGPTAVADFFGTLADASEEGAGVFYVPSFVLQGDIYLTATKTGVGSADGFIEVLGLYVFENSVD